MGIFGNLSPDQLAIGLAGLSASSNMAALPSRVPMPLAYSLSQGVGAIPQGIKQAQDLQSGNMANQMQQLNLQRAQAMQPAILNSMKGGGIFGGIPGGASAGSISPVFQQALQAAYASGDMKQVAAVLQAAAEHDPNNAGAITKAQQDNTLIKTPQGTVATGASLAGGAPGNNNSSGRGEADWDALLKTQGQPSDTQTTPVVSDGKPVLPNQTNLFQSDPTGIPKYKTDNTETGVALTKDMQTSDLKANEAFTSDATSLQNEQFRLKELTNVYKQVQSGTLTAQNPQLANQLIAWGVIKDPKEISNVAQVQNALQSHALQIIQQIKDTNANLGGAPMRTFGSEISNLQEKGEDPGAQPEALWNIIGQAQGIVDHHLDMVKGWDAIGGLGNRQANGYTLRPDDYARKFIQAHDISDYKMAAQKNMGQFKGMLGNPSADQRPPLTSFQGQ